MHPVARLPYAAAGYLATIASRLTPESDSKFLRSLAARRTLTARYRAWAATGRDVARPLLWIHAPSVGEGLQARPVIDLLRARHPELQIAYTFFSPSAEAFARTLAVDFTDFLAFDSASNADAALDALRPTALVFSKLDVWPLLAERAAARRVRLGLIAGTVSESSSRTGPISALLLRDAYAALDAVGAVDTFSGDRLVRLGVRLDRLTITGDTRADQVSSRAAQVDRDGPLLMPLRSDRPTLVAGSTWPSDEGPLFEAWRIVRRRVPAARLIIAPHEPGESSLNSIEGAARGDSLVAVRLGRPGQVSADVVIVDRVGVLGDLYALADVAFVGGGFHAAGLHSVLEPAAFGVPVLFGPRHDANRDATNLIACGGGAAVRDARALAERLGLWLMRGLECDAAGARARTLVQSGVGSAQRTVAIVESLLAGFGRAPF